MCLHRHISTKRYLLPKIADGLQSLITTSDNVGSKRKIVSGLIVVMETDPYYKIGQIDKDTMVS